MLVIGGICGRRSNVLPCKMFAQFAEDVQNLKDWRDELAANLHALGAHRRRSGAGCKH